MASSTTTSPITTTSSSTAPATRDRKPSLSATPHYITAGLSLHTVSTPDEPPPLTHSSSSSNLGGYFSLSRTPSSSKPSRRPSISEPAPPSGAGAFSLKLAHPRTPMFARTNTLPSGPPQPPPTSAPGSHALSAAAGGAMAIGTAPPPTSPHAHFTSLHETCTKRIATLDYLRRSHEGRVYWFNCLLIPRAELQRIVYPDAKKLQKKAVHYFFLGNSLPAILELGTSSPLDYLRAFNALLAEYEAYVTLPPARQQASRAHSGSVSIHHHAHHAPTTTSAASSALRNMSLPKLFSRSSHRRGSTTSSSHAQHDALERTRSASHSSDSDAVPPLPMSITPPSQPPPSFASSGAGGEEYIYLATPALPFEVDYFEVFVTLCDILVDVYSRVLTLVGTPALCAGGVGEAFVKADMKIRKHLMTGIVREWEEAVRVGVKREVQGVAKEVLAGIL